MTSLFSEYLRVSWRWSLLGLAHLCAATALAAVLTSGWCVLLALPLSGGLPPDHGRDPLLSWGLSLLWKVGAVSPGALAFGVGAFGLYFLFFAYRRLQRTIDRRMEPLGFEAGPYQLFGRLYRGRVAGQEVWIAWSVAMGRLTMSFPRLMILVKNEIGAHAEFESRAIHSSWGRRLFGNPEEMRVEVPGLEGIVVRARDEAWCARWLRQPGVVEALRGVTSPRFGAIQQPLRLRHDFMALIFIPAETDQLHADVLETLVGQVAQLARAAASLPRSEEAGGRRMVSLGGDLRTFQQLLQVQRVIRGLLKVFAAGNIALGLLWMLLMTAALLVI